MIVELLSTIKRPVLCKDILLSSFLAIQAFQGVSKISHPGADIGKSSTYFCKMFCLAMFPF